LKIEMYTGIRKEIFFSKIDVSPLVKAVMINETGRSLGLKSV